MASKPKTESLAIANDQDDVTIEGRPLTINTLKRLIGGPTIPNRWKDVGQALTAVKYGEELGLAPFESLYRLYMVNGALAIDSKAMSSLVHRAGHVLIQVETTPERAAYEAHRRDPYTHELMKVGTYEFTWEDAERAGLSQQDTYQDYPTDMLAARAISRACKLGFPDVTTGLLLPEEIGVPPADIDEGMAATAALGSVLDAEEVQDLGHPYN